MSIATWSSCCLYHFGRYFGVTFCGVSLLTEFSNCWISRLKRMIPNIAVQNRMTDEKPKFSWHNVHNHSTFIGVFYRIYTDILINTRRKKCVCGFFCCCSYYYVSGNLIIVLVTLVPLDRCICYFYQTTQNKLAKKRHHWAFQMDIKSYWFHSR